MSTAHGHMSHIYQYRNDRAVTRSPLSSPTADWLKICVSLSKSKHYPDLGSGIHASSRRKPLMASRNLGCFLRLLSVASRHENGNSTLETKLQVFVQAWAQWNFRLYWLIKYDICKNQLSLINKTCSLDARIRTHFSNSYYGTIVYWTKGTLRSKIL